MVSGMLTAIRDFVQDSFHVADADSLEALKVGELSVWIEAGPHAILAAVIRGTAPRDFRTPLQDAIETIHLEFGETLESFNGDASTLDAGAGPSLEALLQTQYRAEERRPRTLSTWILLGVIALRRSLVWAGFAYRTRARDARYLDALRAEPGLTVVSAATPWRTARRVGSPRSARPRPADLRRTGGARPDRGAGSMGAVLRARPADHARARARRAAAAGRDDARAGRRRAVAHAARRRSPGWPRLAGWRRSSPESRGFDAVSVLDESARAVIARIEGQVLLFVKGAARLVAGQDDAVQQMQRDLREVDAIAGATGQRFRIEIVGHTDADGPAESNLPLSRARAAVVQAAIASRPLVAPRGRRRPVSAAARRWWRARTKQDKQKNRRVTIRVTRQAG